MNLFLALAKFCIPFALLVDLLDIVIFFSIGLLDSLLFRNIVCKQIITGDSHFIKSNPNLNLKQEKTDPFKNLKGSAPQIFNIPINSSMLKHRTFLYP